MLYRLLVLCPCAHWCLVHSVQCPSIFHIVLSVDSCHCVKLCLVQFIQGLSVLHNVTSVVSVSLRTLVTCKPVLSLPVPHTVLSVGSVSLRPFCLVLSVHCLPLLHTVPFVSSVSLGPLVSCRVCILSVSNSYCTVCYFCVTGSNGVLFRLSNVCQCPPQYHLLFLCHCFN